MSEGLKDRLVRALSVANKMARAAGLDRGAEAFEDLRREVSSSESLIKELRDVTKPNERLLNFKVGPKDGD